MTQPAAKTVLIALPGATYADLHEHLSAGRTPAIAALARRGWSAPIDGAAPLAGPGGVAEFVSGLPIGRHGLVLDEEAWAGGMRPVTAASWRVAPLWMRLEEAGVATAGVGWPATRPGRDWAGLHVDDRLGRPTGRDWDEWTLPVDIVPPVHREAFRALRVHPTDIGAAMLLPFVPALATIDQDRDRRLVPIALALARLSTDHAAMGMAVRLGRPDALFVHHDLLRSLGRGFRDAPPPYDGVMAAAWTLIDMIVGQTVAAMPGATVILASPGWPGAAGFAILSGGTIAGPAPAGMKARDIAPTLLAAHGLEDRGLPGRNLIAPDRPLRPAAPVDRPPFTLRPAPADDAARIAAIGLKPLAPPPALVARTLAAEAEAVLASDPDLALERAAAALAADPECLLALGVMALVHVGRRDAEPLAKIADRLRSVLPDHPWTDLAQAGALLLSGAREEAGPILERAEGKAADALTLRHVAAGWRQAGRGADAARCYRRILALEPDDAAARIGLAETSGDHPAERERALRHILLRDPANRSARSALARTLRRAGRTHEAAILAPDHSG